MRVSHVLVVGLFCGLFSTTCHAQGVRVVRPVPGYMCMLLSPEDEQATVQSQLPPVLAGPSPSAERIGYPSGIVFVTSPLHQVAGYVEMLRLNGQTGWIEANHLRPWHPMNNTSSKCVPSLMSNGRLGADVH